MASKGAVALLVTAIERMSDKKRAKSGVGHLVRDLIRGLRATAYHLKNGRGFRYHGLQVHVPKTVNWETRKQLMRGTYEAPEKELFDICYLPGLPVVELGGSIGLLSSYVARRLEPGTPFVVVEANADLLPFTRRNIAAANPAISAQVVHAAVAYGADRVSFSTSADFLGGRLADQGGTDDDSVAAITLGKLLESRGIGGDYLAIIDIEGAEYDVFEKDGDVLKRAKAIIVETHPHIFDEKGQTLEAFLRLAREAGFTVRQQIATSYALVRQGA